ncbi:DUF6639 family protein [Falsiroseomonas sp. HC035]|uniref:DUF6639 family protein n=1 Tax=Falsiroseomonas sp. HC035 TaxID=3390999 RepID=UPI003D317A99
MARRAFPVGLRPRWRLALPLLLLSTPGRAVARDERCTKAPLRIEAATDNDLIHACEAWRRVEGFLVVQRGLRMTAPLDLIFAERVELDLGATTLRVLGRYERSRRILRVTSAQADWLREPDRLMFRQPIDAEMHTSLIVHELAHALLLDNFRVAEPGRVCSEYMAYVVQLATMQPATLMRVLAQYPEDDFASLAEITEIAHLMDPHGFGIRAYRHFMREGHATILDDILGGKVGTDLPM